MYTKRKQKIGSDFMKNVSEKLIVLRGERTQKEVAENIGITASALANYEAGIRMPRDEIKKKIAKYYKVSVGEIFFEE